MNREQILALQPGQQTNILIHMRLMGNKAWGHHRGSGNDKYVFVQFAPEQPKRKGVTFWEMELGDIDHHDMVVADVPDYTGDIAAAWKVEEALQIKGFWVLSKYALALSSITGWNDEYPTTTAAFKLIHASPLNRCRAALLATLDPRGGDTDD